MSTVTSLILVVATVFALVLGYIAFYKSRKRLYELAALIPGVPQVPLFGNAFQFSGNPVDITHNLKRNIALSLRRHGVVKTWLWPFLYTTMTRPEDVEIVLNSELQKDNVYRFMKPWLGNGLVTGDCKLYEIFGDSGREVARDDLSKMKYLERVIKETLRLFPVAPIVVRQIVKEVQLEKYTLPAGSGCVLAFYGIHRDQKIWGERAEEFDPDNFLPEKCVNRHPYSFIPFSAGPRNCIGRQFAIMSMKTVLSTLLRSLKVKSEMDYKTIDVLAAILLKPVDGYKITVEPRN